MEYPIFNMCHTWSTHRWLLLYCTMISYCAVHQLYSTYSASCGARQWKRYWEFNGWLLYLKVHDWVDGMKKENTVHHTVENGHRIINFLCCDSKCVRTKYCSTGRRVLRNEFVDSLFTKSVQGVRVRASSCGLKKDYFGRELSTKVIISQLPVHSTRRKNETEHTVLYVERWIGNTKIRFSGSIAYKIVINSSS